MQRSSSSRAQTARVRVNPESQSPPTPVISRQTATQRTPPPRLAETVPQVILLTVMAARGERPTHSRQRRQKMPREKARLPHPRKAGLEAKEAGLVTAALAGPPIPPRPLLVSPMHPLLRRRREVRVGTLEHWRGKAATPL
jgi:hypothetical protein